MTESEEFKDDLIQEIVKNGSRSLPNDQFEDQMMLRIQKELDYKNEVSAQLKTSLQFFVGACILVAVLILIVLMGQVLDQYDIKTIAIFSLFVACVIGILNLDNYRRLIERYTV